MAIALDNSARNASSGTSQSFSYTCSGTNRVLVAMTASDGANTATDVTYGGVALTKIDSDRTANHPINLWYLINPASGSNTLSATGFANAGNYVVALSLTGVKQNNPLEVSNGGTGSGTSMTRTVITTSDNCWAVLAGTTGGVTAITAGSNSTIVTSAINSDSTSALFQSGGAITPAGSFSMTFDGANATKAGIIAAFAPVLIISATESITMTDTLATFVRRKVIAVNDILSVIETHIISAIESITMSDTLQSFKKGWKNTAKNISNWINQNKN